ncbi:MAG: class D sortase [Vicinamibacteria bacterium]|nr:class D sortase [Vicinamibacteria bacterium]
MRRRVLRTIERALLSIGLLCLGCYGAAEAQAGWFSLRQEARFHALRGGDGDRPVDLALPLRSKMTLRRTAGSEEAWGRIEVPRLGLRAFIAEGVDAGTLRVAVGHVPDTAFPDEGGNIALAGHRDTFFRPLSDLVLADVITLVTPLGAFRYEVESIDIVTPDRTDFVARGVEDVLTLVTCYPFDVLGHAPLRLIARARPVGVPRTVLGQRTGEHSVGHRTDIAGPNAETGTSQGVRP